MGNSQPPPRAQAPRIQHIGDGKAAVHWVVPKCSPKARRCDVTLYRVITLGLYGHDISTAGQYEGLCCECGVVNFDNLAPGEYRADVRFFNDIGAGEWSTHSTSVKIYSPPTASPPQLSALATDRLRVTWEAPRCIPRALNCKVVLKRADDSRGDMRFGVSYFSSSGIQAAQDCEWECIGVPHGSTFVASVSFSSVAGWWGQPSSLSEPLKHTVPACIQQAPTLEMLDAGSMKVNWNAPQQELYAPPIQSCLVNIDKLEPHHAIRSTCFKVLSVPASVRQCIVEGLEYGFEYQASMTFRNAVGTSERSQFSKTVSLCRPQASPPAVECIDADKIHVRWSIPTCSLAPTACHVWVMAGAQRSLWDHTAARLLLNATAESSVKPLLPSMKQTTITGLSKSIEYRVSIAFSNSAGWGPCSVSSAPLVIRDPPAAPEPTLQPLGNDCARVSWVMPLSSPGITHCDVFMRMTGTDVWHKFDSRLGRIVDDEQSADGVLSPSSRCVVMELQQGGVYEARIRFRNVVGRGPFSPNAMVSLPGRRSGSINRFDEEMEEGDEEEDEFDTSAGQSNIQPTAVEEQHVKVAVALHIIFMVDSSRSMGKRDLDDTSDRRIDAVLLRVEEFVQKHRVQSAAGNDVFSFVTFSSTSKVHFSQISASEVLGKLAHIRQCCVLKPSGPTDYVAGLKACLSPCMQAEIAMRIIFLSDGRPGEWNRKAVHWFQWTFLPTSKELEVHTVGFGPDLNDFEVLQQMAHLGRGGFQVASLDQDQLRCAFTSIAASLTSTRLRSTSTGTGVAACVGTGVAGGSQRRDLAFTSPMKPTEKCLNGLKLDCMRKMYVWDAASISLRLEQQVRTSTVRRKQPHTKGNMRYVFAFNDLSSPNTKMVSKETLFRATDEDTELSFARSSAVAAHYANMFGELTGASVHVVQCYLYEALGPEKAVKGQLRFFCGEPFVPGVFVKWIGNFGYINSSGVSELPACFAHFTHAASNGHFMVSDIQGVFQDKSFTITDPQVLSHNQSFGRADLGQEGMTRFLEQHSCGELCKHLGLDPASMAHLGGGRWRPPAGLQPFPGLASLLNAGTPASPPVGTSQQQAAGSEVHQRQGVRARPATLLGDRLMPQDLVGPIHGRQRRLLFVGECTMSFCASAAKVASSTGMMPWTASELVWPAVGDAAHDREMNRQSCVSRGIRVVAEPVDARSLRDVGVHDVDGVIWAMPYPDAYSPHAGKPSPDITLAMQELVHGFIHAAAPLVQQGAGRISIIIMSQQHLTWKLRCDICVPGVGCFVPEMRVFSLAPFLNAGYRPRFGDRRDTWGRQAAYHRHGEAVIVQWRYQAAPSDAPAGMTDTRLRRRT
mmetsp:Transcript_38581/g.111469  ORF Transcript_38581/g.111469 Transcript_38581/m.111469 type:complete len:1344 (+) Transcript_38581:26-4057(+)